MLGKMIAIAAKAHEGQFDKGGKPYILHPLAVMNILNSDDEELNCIAVGHDLLEDTDVTTGTLFRAGMSDRVVFGIVDLTKWKGQTYESYQGSVFSNRDAMLVKRADLIHNSDLKRLKGVTPKDMERVDRYFKFYNEINKRLANV